MFKVVMFHYIGEMGLTPESFREKLCPPIRTLDEAIEKGGNVLTFDDGLKDSVTNILPIMKEVSAVGIFFIPSSLLVEKRVLPPQKRHLLLRKLGSARLIEILNSRLPAEFAIKEDPSMQADYLDDLKTASMKWILDFLDYDIIEPILDKTFEEELGSEHAAFDKLYLSKEDMISLYKEGNEIGAHGRYHRQLGQLSVRDQELELEHSKEIGSMLGIKETRSISYPSGSYSPLTLRICEKLGFKYGFTIKKHMNSKESETLTLGRFDCVDI